MGKALLLKRQTSWIFLALFSWALSSCSGDKKFLYPLPLPNEQIRLVENIRSYQYRHGGDIDILFVIDNSQSMKLLHDSVADNAALFFKDFIRRNSDLHWRVGLMSTAWTEKPYIGMDPSTILDSGSTDPVSRFREAIRKLGTDGDNNEQFFWPLKNAMSDYSWFFRKHAALAVIVVTDTDDGVDQWEGLKPDPYVTAGLLKDFKKGQPISMYGIFSLPDVGGMNCQGEREGIFYDRSRYRAFFMQFPSEVYAGCDPKFGENLSEIGKSIISSVPMYLPRIPIYIPAQPGTMEITYNGEPLLGGPDGVWDYDMDEGMIYFNDKTFFIEGVDDVVITYRRL
ncbi:hypothetical protein K2X30_10300 [bacterium]|nr:hypothetical protein [bacterium]